jgi:hypothetical protein
MNIQQKSLGFSTLSRRISEEPTIFISDRDKGLGAANDELGDGIIRAICAYHLMDNFTTKFSRTLKPLFWKIARANSKARFESLMDELREINSAAALYLELAQPELWAKSYLLHWNAFRP